VQEFGRKIEEATGIKYGLPQVRKFIGEMRFKYLQINQIPAKIDPIK
jgi:hypothetical protein